MKEYENSRSGGSKTTGETFKKALLFANTAYQGKKRGANPPVKEEEGRGSE